MHTSSFDTDSALPELIVTALISVNTMTEISEFNFAEGENSTTLFRGKKAIYYYLISLKNVHGMVAMMYISHQDLAEHYTVKG